MSIGIKPTEFWSLTPWEFGCAIDGATQRRHYEQETVANMTANLVNPHLAKGHHMSGTDYYRRPDAPPEFSDPREAAAYMRRRKQSTEQEDLDDG